MLTAKLARKGYQDPARQFNLIEDLLDVLTVTGAERVIDYMESRAERLTAVIVEGGRYVRGGLTLSRPAIEHRAKQRKRTGTFAIMQ